MKISAIIPAYNEAERIHQVLGVLRKMDIINEIIVVSDGSTDDTAAIARKFTTHVIELDDNIGKGGAIAKGIAYCDAEVVLLLDADLIGLTEHHIYNLLEPVLKNEADTTIGIFNSGRFHTDAAQKITPFLSGQRAVKYEIAKTMLRFDITRYGFELAFTKYLRKKNLRVKKVFLHDVTHVIKEEKLGMIKGFASRLKMYWQIVTTLSLNIK